MEEKIKELTLLLPVEIWSLSFLFQTEDGGRLESNSKYTIPIYTQ